MVVMLPVLRETYCVAHSGTLSQAGETSECFCVSVKRPAVLAALEQSGTLDQLVALAAKHVASFGPSELTFVLDGMARLRVKAPTGFLTSLAKQVVFVVSLDVTASSHAHRNASLLPCIVQPACAFFILHVHSAEH